MLLTWTSVTGVKDSMSELESESDPEENSDMFRVVTLVSESRIIGATRLLGLEEPEPEASEIEELLASDLRGFQSQAIAMPTGLDASVAFMRAAGSGRAFAFLATLHDR